MLSTIPADERGKRFGIVTSIASFAAVFAFVGSLVQLTSRKGMVFKWQYKSYYGLTLLAGLRR